jgi:hypothetical protein
MISGPAVGDNGTGAAVADPRDRCKGEDRMGVPAPPGARGSSAGSKIRKSR